MNVIPHPGVSEQGWLADLKETAERIGFSVLGEPVRWEVEGLTASSGRRADVIIRRDTTGVPLATGEAKRPDTPKGIHPLVASEVRDAIEKAQLHGAPLCFTTNFFEVAVFDARVDTHYATDLDRHQGGLINLVPPGTAAAPSWWSTLPSAQRTRLAEGGLRQLFEQLQQSARQGLARDVNETTLHVFGLVTDRLLGPLFEAFLTDRDARHLPGDLLAHALQVQLNPSEDGEARFLVAQGIAEVLTATLFYRTICDYFSLQPLMAGTSPATAALLVRRLSQSFARAIRASGDYETIFSLSPAAQWVLSRGDSGVLQQWKDLFEFVDQLDFTAVSSDVIGAIFERLIGPERRHTMGQHYTDARIARSITAWAVREATDTVADVACGAGTFLVEAWKALAALGLTHSRILGQVFGNDLDPFAVHLATVNMATREIYQGANYPAIRLGDAFRLRPGDPILHIMPLTRDALEIRWPAEGVDAIVGNPPYATRPEEPEALSKALHGLGCPPPQDMDGNLAAWFGLLVAALVKPNGRWGLVLPTGVLQNANLAPWRRWLRQNFDVVVWHTEHDVWFSDARVATCVVLAEKPASGATSLHFVQSHEPIRGDLVDIDGVPSPSTNASVRDLSALPPSEDILVAGTRPTALATFGSSPNVGVLGQLAGVTPYYGNKLGHAMYQLHDLSPGSPGLLRDVVGHRLRIRLSRDTMIPLLRSPLDERTGEFAGSAYWALNAPERLPSKGALHAYIAHCKRLGVHRLPSVAQRGKAWWHVEWRPCQVAVALHPGFRHQVWWSDKPFIAKNNFQVLAFEESVPKWGRELIAASLASCFGGLAALFLSSEVGNEGVRWLSTEQFASWPALDPAKVSTSDGDAVLASYRTFRLRPAQEGHLLDPETAAAWLDLTTAVARAAGAANPAALADEALEEVRETCVRRAARETVALSGRVRTGVRRGTFVRQIQERIKSWPEIGAILDQLTNGPRVIRLRSTAQLAQGVFAFEDAGPSIQDEEALSAVLPAGFECAPGPSGGGPLTLARNIEAMLEGLTEQLAGQPPRGQRASATYSELVGTIRQTAIAWLQQETHSRLG